MKTIRKTRLKKSSPQNDKSRSDTLAAALDQFLEHHPARRLSTNLRKLLVEFLQFDGAAEASYLQDLLYDLEGLWEVLEVASVEKKS